MSYRGFSSFSVPFIGLSQFAPHVRTTSNAMKMTATQAAVNKKSGITCNSSHYEARHKHETKKSSSAKRQQETRTCPSRSTSTSAICSTQSWRRYICKYSKATLFCPETPSMVSLADVPCSQINEHQLLMWCIFVCHPHLTTIICCTAVGAQACGLERVSCIISTFVCVGNHVAVFRYCRFCTRL